MWLQPEYGIYYSMRGNNIGSFVPFGFVWQRSVAAGRAIIVSKRLPHSKGTQIPQTNYCTVDFVRRCFAECCKSLACREGKEEAAESLSLNVSLNHPLSGQLVGVYTIYNIFPLIGVSFSFSLALSLSLFLEFYTLMMCFMCVCCAPSKKARRRSVFNLPDERTSNTAQRQRRRNVTYIFFMFCHIIENLWFFFSFLLSVSFGAVLNAMRSIKRVLSSPFGLCGDTAGARSRVTLLSALQCWKNVENCENAILEYANIVTEETEPGE